MNYRVYLLALTAFAAGIDENIVGGLVPIVAKDLNVSISTAGQLTSIFSIVFAIFAPLLLSWTASFERTKLLKYTLCVFAIGNFLSAISVNYAMLFTVRIISAASCSLIIVLATTIASSIVSDTHKGRAIGIVFMGISGSLVLGVPIGLLLSNIFSWRAPFLFITTIALIFSLSLPLVLPKIPCKPTVPLKKYWIHLKDLKMLSGQMISILLIGGHFTLYAYLAPYVQRKLDISGDMMSVIYFLFGIAAVTGGYLGGWISDKLGFKQAVVLIPSIFIISLGSIPFTTSSIYLFIPFMMIWSCLSWTISPSVQNYLIHSDERNGDVSIGVNTSAMHIGVALGSIVGGTVIKLSSIEWNPWVGSFLVFLSLLFSLYSISRKPKIQNQVNC